jgi:osmotically-inducible protein OsmY
MFTDNRIEEDVRAALHHDPRIKHPELIAVSVDGIGTVVLRGAVGTLPERLAAADDARDVEGVFEVVVEDLKVHPPVGRRRRDDEIRAAALQRLIWDARIRSTHLHVKVAHGHLTLTGYVREQSESDAAADDAATVAGVVGVTNQIEIR